jgi:hypothetical protein
MATDKQKLGEYGVSFVKKNFHCPRCKRKSTLWSLIPNFECADIICNFCGYLAQVKAKNVEDVNTLPDMIPGAGWNPQEKRLNVGVYFSLFVVLVSKRGRKKEHSVYFLPAELQERNLYQPRNPLSPTAKRAGWQGFDYDLRKFDKSRFTRLL